MDATCRLEEANTIELYKNSYTAMYVQVYIQCNDNKGATLREKKNESRKNQNLTVSIQEMVKLKRVAQDIEAGCLGDDPFQHMMRRKISHRNIMEDGVMLENVQLVYEFGDM